MSHYVNGINSLINEKVVDFLTDYDKVANNILLSSTIPEAFELLMRKFKILHQPSPFRIKQAPSDPNLCEILPDIQHLDTEIGDYDNDELPEKEVLKDEEEQVEKQEEQTGQNTGKEM